MEIRQVFFVSDRTGITAEKLGQSLLSQFEGQHFQFMTLPFINSVQKARTTAEYISLAAKSVGERPIIFSTVVGEEIRLILQESDGLFLDLFDSYIKRLEDELETKSSYTVGRVHASADTESYRARIDAVNYTLQHDDGSTVTDYARADIILVAVSRCGKTPTCVYLAMQFGLRAANYPLTEEDLDNNHLPVLLTDHIDKLYALTTKPEHLARVRNERRPDSRYSSIRQVTWELLQAEKLYRRNNIPVTSTHDKSIEEISSLIMHEKKIPRLGF